MISLLTDDIESPLVKILRFVATGTLSGVDQNHTLPLLDILRDGNLVFGVFPFGGSWCHTFGFETVFQAFHFMEQILEVSAER